MSIRGVFMANSTYYSYQFVLAATFGAVIACSPTRFSPNTTPTSVCDSSVTTCVVVDGITNISQSFKVGAGKVDILFVNDNSASMSVIQSKLAAKFGGFIENLDSKDIDYRISMTTTDLLAVQQSPLITFGNGLKTLSKNDSGRVGLFNSAIARPETIACEDFIKSSFYTYGAGFMGTSYYGSNYNKYCPSNDERGLFTASEVLSKNVNNLIRADANLNIILVSNEDVRSGLYNSTSTQYASEFALDAKDRATNFTNMISSVYPGKYWEFNSIITKDNSCALSQMNDFKDNVGNPIKDASGNYVIGANVGLEYAALSASASTDVDGNPAPRGQILSICNNDYTAYFNNIAAQISQASRLMTLRCTPATAPSVVRTGNSSFSVPYQWQGDKILFQAGSEGIAITVSYQCRVAAAH
jgi:hypothetical protein